jgi:hypothetical protein
MFYFYFLSGAIFTFLIHCGVRQKWIIEEMDETTYEIIKKMPRLDVQMAAYCYTVFFLTQSFTFFMFWTTLFVFYFYFTKTPFDVFQTTVCFILGIIVGYYTTTFYHASLKLPEKENTCTCTRMSNWSWRLADGMCNLLQPQQVYHVWSMQSCLHVWVVFKAIQSGKGVSRV